MQGSIVNNGTIALNAGGYNNSFLQLQANTTLSGGGTVTLGSDGTATAFIQQGQGGLTLTNADNTIQGYGVIGNGGLTVINNGTINANVSGQTLTLNGSGGVTNTGTLEATGGGILGISNITVNDAVSSIQANGAGSSVLIQNSNIVGGALTTTGGGTIGQGNSSWVLLDGLTQVGSTPAGVTISNGTTWNTGHNSTTYVQGSIVNKGTIALNAGGYNNSYLQLQANTTLSGGGTVTLGSDGTATAFIQQGQGGLTLTNADNTIQGYGTIGNGGLTVINNGTINANVSGQTLTLNGSGGVTNTGTLEATNGGTLSIQGIAVYDAVSSIQANGAGSSVLIQNSNIVGGALTTTGGGTIGQGNSSWVLLDGLTQVGSTPAGVTISNGTTWNTGSNSITNVQGSIVNNGTIALNAGGYNNSFLQLQANTTLSGGGTVTLGSDGTATAFIQQGQGGLTLTNADNTIQGYGVIGNGGLTVINNGTINANVSGQTLTLNGSGGVTNNGTLQATNGGTLALNSPVQNGGTVNAQKNSAVYINSTYTQTATGRTVVNGSLFTAAPTFEFNAGVLSGSGTVFSNVQADAGAIVHPGDSPGILTINGSYANNGGTLAIDIVNLKGGPGTGFSQLDVTGTATLGTAALGGPLGTLEVDLLPGAVINTGEEFDILHSAGLNGTFAPLTGADASLFTVLYTDTDVILEANSSFGAPVPLPPSLLLLAPGLVGLAGRRWLAGRRG